MDKFRVLRAIAAPLLRENVDTDIVIRIERLVGATQRNALGGYAFESWRFKPDGSEEPGFVLNREPYRRAEILLALRNFGCGSSREGAVWALKQKGFRAVLAPSFGDIFFNNCYQNGVLPVVMAEAAVRAIARQVEADPERNLVTVDLARQVVVAPDGGETGFAIDRLRREALLEGLDDIGLTLKREGEIAAFQAEDRARRPWIWAV
ncbi:MAG TPA: 3-isopropylmalate dehydratase small subunit, partial [Stellaceae bacterium]|nr:3-isopropylmalate dehydratase small subunit [Stellaceae bacterium]